jgi:drug/metabolite transporter (DMT)-like permease
LSGSADPARQRAAGFALALVGAVAFSGKAIIVKLSYRHGVDAVTVIMLRMLFALPLFLALAWWGARGREPLKGRDRVAVGALGFCGYYLASFLDFLGLQYVTASLERLILYLNPSIVLLLGWLLLKRPPTRRQIIVLLLSYAGVLLVFGHEVSLQGREVLLGSTLVLASALSYALYLVYSGEVVRRIGALRLTGLATSVASVLCILQFPLLRPPQVALQANDAVLALAVLNALACTFAPVVMVMLAIERIGPVATSQAGMIGPLTTVALGVWLLGEPFTAWLVGGTALVLFGITLLVRGR